MIFDWQTIVSLLIVAWAARMLIIKIAGVFSKPEGMSCSGCEAQGGCASSPTGNLVELGVSFEK